MGKDPRVQREPGGTAGRPLRFAPVLWRALLQAAGDVPDTHPLAGDLARWRSDADALKTVPLLGAVHVNTLIRTALHGSRSSALGIDIGRTQTLSSFGPAGFAMMTSATLGEAFRVGLHYQRLIGTPLLLHAETVGDDVHLHLQSGVALHTDVERFLIEEFLASLIAILRQETGRDLRPTRTELTSPALPPDTQRRYHAAFGDITLGAPGHVTVVPAWWFPLPLLRADPAAHRDAVAWCERLSYGEAQRAGHTFDAQVRDCLRQQPADARHLTDVAAVLGLHPRTVRHRLARLGTSFRALRAEVLADQAQEWLTSSGASTDHIAHELGYSDARSLRRAVRNWTGRTPHDLRQQPSTAAEDQE